MERVRILDCTLRDGGCVNQFNFGKLYMNHILRGLEKSGVEMIELGYIDEKQGSEAGRTQYSSDKAIYNTFLKNKKKGVTYLAMVDYGKYSPDLLQSRTEETIDGIRLAFHKEDRKNMLKWGRTILDKGYQLFVQPMTCLRYSEEEMQDLISDVNRYLPEASAFYIVDSFGEMRLQEMNRIARLIDQNLNEDIPMGLHSHNNLQLSYSNAVTLLNFSMERELIFDSSIMGMGKGAGNMNTELFADHLNMYRGKSYNIEALLEVVDKAINQIRANYSWGYSIEYYLSAINHCSPSYASYFYKKHMLSVEQISELLAAIAEDKKNSFDEAYANELYYKFNAHNYDDSENVKRLGAELKGNTILLVAPGKSVLDYKEKVENYSKQKGVIMIALNNRPNIRCDYVFVTKLSAFELVAGSDMSIIVSSNVPIETNAEIIVNYDVLTRYGNKKSDNSAIMLINLLLACDVKKIVLAGFDGFSTVFDDNYYDENLKRPIEKAVALERNGLIKSYLAYIKDSIEIEFLTPSMYMD